MNFFDTYKIEARYIKDENSDYYVYIKGEQGRSLMKVPSEQLTLLCIWLVIVAEDLVWNYL